VYLVKFVVSSHSSLIDLCRSQIMELGLEADTSSSMSDLEKKALERKRRLEQMKEQMGRGNSNGSNSTAEGDRREYGN
jgi:hypothetical protein